MTRTSLPFWLLCAAAACAADEPPWSRLYSGEQATGKNVIALWQFLPGQETKDNSGRGHALKLRGQSRFVKDGRFGSCLESFPADVKHDRAQGAITKNRPDLSPRGAFTIEMWIKPKPEFARRAAVFLLDKKYYHYAKPFPKANWDYCFYVRRASKGLRRLVAYLGYGEDSAEYSSQPIELPVGEWSHVAFTYDGKGVGRFFLNGQYVGRTAHEGRGPITPGRYDLVIGDRYGSIHSGFPGYIDQVRICRGVVPYFTGSLSVGVGGRAAFRRMEKNARVRIRIVNDTTKPLTRVAARIVFGGRARTVELGSLPADAERVVASSVDTTLRPGAYPLTVRVTARAGSRSFQAETAFDVHIVARPLPHVMPVLMWGHGDLKRLKEIGFTHQLVHLADYGRIWKAGGPTEAGDADFVRERGKMLDDYLVQGVGACVYLYPGRWVVRNAKLREKFQRINREGKPYPNPNACGQLRAVQRFCYNVGASVAKTFGSFPALQASLIHSEIRDGTHPCFHQEDKDAYRRFAHRDIPAEITAKRFRHYSTIPGFPRGRVLPDDDPILTYYRWFWKQGDAWNLLHSLVHKGLKSTGRTDLWTFFDPAVRCPSIWGSGGDVDILSQWTYTYPDPIKIGQAADELFAMAAGGPAYQRVMKMTQIIWYRSQTAPNLPKDPAQRAQWEKDIPDARFITIAPDFLSEALWCELSRPVRGVMYHGWGSLVPLDKPRGYRYTNPHTRVRLARLIRQVVRPLGPMLLQLPDGPSDIAVLESFTSQMFASRGTWGWSGGWGADAHLVLQWAHFQPRIVYEETILRDGLDAYKVLVLPDCDVLTRSVVKRIQAFQDRGGLLVADEDACPALAPDILLPRYKRTRKPDKDKASLQARGAALSRELAPFYQRVMDCDNADVVIRLRRYRDADYLFAVNDRRTFGHYVGHHGLVMDKGLPTRAALWVRRPAGRAYDLCAHKETPVRRRGDGIEFDAAFGPGEGKVFLLTTRPIAGVRIDAPARARLEGRADVRIAVVDDRGEPLPIVAPLRVDILDPQGRPAEFSGYYGAKDGRLALHLDLARNDLPGRWTIRVKDLAASREAQRVIDVSR